MVAEALGKHVGELESRLDRPESTAKLNEIGFLNHLILRKDLSWTKLFGILEEMVPQNVHLHEPDAGRRRKRRGDAPPRSAGSQHCGMSQFIERLEHSPLFEMSGSTPKRRRIHCSNGCRCHVERHLLSAEGYAMKVYRRRRQQYLFAGLLGAIAIINVMFFLIMYRPNRLEYFRLQESIQKAGSDIRSRQQRITRLEKLSAQLETSAQDRSRLYLMHFIPKQSGWSEILPQLDANDSEGGSEKCQKGLQPGRDGAIRSVFR